MTIGQPITPPTWRTSLLIAVAGHLLFSVLVIWGPALGLFPKRERGPEIMMVRLRGGGQNIPGWVKPNTAAPDKSLEPDNRPQAPAKKTTAAPKREEAPPPPVKQEPKPVHQQQEKPPEPESASQEAAPAQQTQPAQVETTTTVDAGAGIGAKPGPEGPGIGAHSDASFPGADLFLSRVETEVQRRFNYRGRGTKKVTEYHFFIEKDGSLKELILMQSSGIPSMDLSARSALLRSKFPPLPPGFEHEHLGVTYRFYDDK